MSRVTRLILGALATTGLLAVGVGVAVAAFTAITANSGNSFSAAGSFAAQVSSTGFNLRDASAGGAEADSSWPLAFDDLSFDKTANWAATYSATRYVDIDLNSPLPAGRTVSNVNFRLKFASGGGAGSGNACFYFEVRRASTGAVLSTHGSSGSPIACSVGTTQLVSTTNISAAVPNTTIANDLRIRVLGMETGAKAFNIDSATVTGDTPQVSYTQYTRTVVDAADTTPATDTWGLSTAGDTFTYVSAANWAVAFSATRYLKVGFPAYVPTGSTITSASFAHAYKANTGGNTDCWYFEVYNGATLIGTHGSAAVPVSCNATAAFVTNTVPLPELDTVAEANNAVIKIFMRDSGTRKSAHDLATLTINY
jgi:hypothetical protein